MPILTPQTVRKANECEDWRAFRKWLLAKPTSEKVRRLRAYLIYKVWPDQLSNAANCNGCNAETRWVQCYAYLNRLAATGRITPVYSQDLELERIEVLK